MCSRRHLSHSIKIYKDHETTEKEMLRTGDIHQTQQKDLQCANDRSRIWDVALLAKPEDTRISQTLLGETQTTDRRRVPFIWSRAETRLDRSRLSTCASKHHDMQPNQEEWRTLRCIMSPHDPCQQSRNRTQNMIKETGRRTCWTSQNLETQYLSWANSGLR